MQLLDMFPIKNDSLSG